MVRIHPDPPGTRLRLAAGWAASDSGRVFEKRADRGASRRRVRAAGTRGGEQRRAATLIEDRGAVAQLGEHLLCKQGVVGSIPISSTKIESRPGL